MAVALTSGEPRTDSVRPQTGDVPRFSAPRIARENPAGKSGKQEKEKS
jgi:hypothetical protein